jgi:hypothetical protein
MNSLENEKKEVTISMHSHKTQEISELSQDADDQQFEPIDLKIDKEEILTKNDFYANPSRVHKKIKNFELGYSYKRVGNTLTFWYDKQGDPRILIGPHCTYIHFYFYLTLGPFYICLSSVIAFCVYLYFQSLWEYINPIYRTIGIFIYFAQFLSYTYTFLKNPGLPKYNLVPDEVSPNAGVNFCQECRIYIDKNKKVKHCPDCNVCIEGNILINKIYIYIRA